MQTKRIHKLACKCSSKKKLRSQSSISSISTGILIALIPKCPYCILAYSSAITMCSGAKMYSHSPSWTSYLLLALAGLTLVFILLNYKGRRTIAAAALVAVGTLLMFASQFYTFEINHYYIGTTLILFGIWVNASFRFFFRKWVQPLFN